MIGKQMMVRKTIIKWNGITIDIHVIILNEIISTENDFVQNYDPL